jgi:hypothetical protein
MVHLHHMPCSNCNRKYRIPRRNITKKEQVFKCFSCINNNVRCINIFYNKNQCLNNTSKKNNKFCGSCIKRIRNTSKCLKCNKICWSPFRDIYNGYRYSIYHNFNNILYNDIYCNNHRIPIRNNIIIHILPTMAIILKKNTNFDISIIIFEMLCSKKDIFWIYDNLIYNCDLKQLFINLIK